MNISIVNPNPTTKQIVNPNSKIKSKLKNQIQAQNQIQHL